MTKCTALHHNFIPYSWVFRFLFFQADRKPEFRLLKLQNLSLKMTLPIWNSTCRISVKKHPGFIRLILTLFPAMKAQNLKTPMLSLKQLKTVSCRRDQLPRICNIGQSGSHLKNSYTDAVWKLNQSAIELEYLTLNP